MCPGAPLGGRSRNVQNTTSCQSNYSMKLLRIALHSSKLLRISTGYQHGSSCPTCDMFMRHDLNFLELRHSTFPRFRYTTYIHDVHTRHTSIAPHSMSKCQDNILHELAVIAHNTGSLKALLRSSHQKEKNVELFAPKTKVLNGINKSQRSCSVQRNSKQIFHHTSLPSMRCIHTVSV